MINSKKFALGMGIFIGGLHLIRLLLVAIIPGYFQQFINRVVGMHFIQSTIVMLPFNFWKALLLVVITNRKISVIKNTSREKQK
ncbi:MAG: hypothetical protein NTX91_04725 [candidate division SR1 bacterium]|nr:hypothetical protein [candidate division SR1 bacterium]